MGSAVFQRSEQKEERRDNSRGSSWREAHIDPRKEYGSMGCANVTKLQVRREPNIA